MRYAKIRKYDTSNGQGIRTTLFVSGCTHNCKGCFNKDAQSFSYGDEWTNEIEEQFIEYVKNDKVVGVNILGGEPMQQIKDKTLLNLLSRIKRETGKSIWMWTGYEIEEILEKNNLIQLSMLCLVDVLIDGKFVEELKDLKLLYRGSSNQRVIDVPASIEQSEIVLLKMD